MDKRQEEAFWSTIDVLDSSGALLYAPLSSVKGLPGLPVQKLPDIIASGNKSEQERTPRDRCS